MSSAVHFLNQRSITHCDIKLENILLGELGQVKLYDFGFDTQLVEDQMLQDLWGSLPYWTPDIVARNPYDGMAGDMWSLGIVLYAMETGQFPYDKSTNEVMYCLITTTVCPISNHLISPIISSWPDCSLFITGSRFHHQGLLKDHDWAILRNT